ncbi:helix-turn-helix domain-containing protein [Pedobacter endophyticus]|uniref:Helix-turn-helix transcriptional regulator n=1 Tax=Pedobacter endophyticus TaxID=2789740 RepID=A0A7U3Q6J5_9SPHI|nr:AraC family transcriptional regulator [Pedobacter endophyticus]QPH38690.1 helix-turn-helix transcriptional regulator [Pedobacter endophyticus]
MSADREANVLKEQFIPDTIFLFVAKGTIQTYDGNKKSIFRTGDAIIAQKNRLAKYELPDEKDAFEPIVFCFDEDFLREFKAKHNIQPNGSLIGDSFVKLPKNKFINSFITSIKPYHKGIMELEKEFETVKYEELLLILLKVNPELADSLFDFRKPGKIDLEAFMNKHYAFNVSNERFATLTGRSLSAFKRDFKTIFNDTPSHWLVKKRLEEAHFLINKEGRKPKDFYLELGFESLSHFSVAYKNKFGYAPSRQADK